MTTTTNQKLEKTEIEDSLQNCPNEYMTILKSGVPLQEKLTQIYKKALEPSVFNFYKYKHSPYVPNGFMEDRAKYADLTDNLKAKGWEKLQKKYWGYFKAKNTAEIENKSNLMFLVDMCTHFGKNGFPKEAEQCQNRIDEFKNPVREDFV